MGKLTGHAVGLHTEARMWKTLARKAFEGRKYKDVLDLYLEALKQSAAATSADLPAAAAEGNDKHARDDRMSATSRDSFTSHDQQQQDKPASTGAESAEPPEFAVLCSNIAAVLLKLDRAEEALQYAAAAVEAAPHWPKAMYRQACALMECQQHDPAITLLKQLQQKTEPETPEARCVMARLHEAVTYSTSHHHHLATQSALLAAHTAWAETRTAELSGRASLLNQLQQGMAGVIWEPVDWEWRPTWLPGMRATQQQQQQQHDDDDHTADNTSLISSSDSPVASDDTSNSPVRSRTTNHCGDGLLDGLSTAFDSAEQQQQYLQLLAELTLRLAGLEGPQRGCKVLQDDALLSWYKEGLAAAVAAKKAAGVDQPVVLVVAHGGGGFLGMLAAAAGAAKVYVVEQSRWGFRAAKQLLEGNQGARSDLVGRVEVVPVPLNKCRVRQQQQQQQQEQPQGVQLDADSAAVSVEKSRGSDCRSSSDGDADGVARVIENGVGSHGQFYELHQAADILVTDMFDCSVLGQGLLPMLQQSASQGLLAQDAILLPSHVVIKGQLVNTHMESLMSNASGFDVRGVNRYKWHPTMERIEQDRLTQYQGCSEAFQLMSLDLARSTRSPPGSAATQSSHNRHGANTNTSSGSSSNNTVHVQLTGSCDACVVWFDLVSSTGRTITTRNCHPGSSSRGSSSSSSVQGISLCSRCFGLGLYYLDYPLLLSSPDPAASPQQQPTVNISATTVMHQQLSISVSSVSSIGSSESPGADSTALGGLDYGCYSWSPHGTPRHAYLPRWHFDMLADETRNHAYDAAIRRQVKRLQQCQSQQDASTSSRQFGVHVLDIGTGTGLLAMMAARAGAETVTAVESVRHLAETAREVVALNRLHTRVNVIHKDGRYLTMSGEGVAGDMPRPADLLAFEVFDCGLIGEGALHIVASARSTLLRTGARVLPAAAKVYCQPIQYQREISTVLSGVCDPAPLYCYSWQPDYFEVDLANTCSTLTPTDRDSNPSETPKPCRAASAGAAHKTAPIQTWHALAEPQLAFDFDFNCTNPQEAFQPAAKCLEFGITHSGVCNAVAFWFDLQLDEVTTLSNSPYVSQQPGQCSTTWKQAVQLLPDHQADVGQVLTLTASHNTYAIGFTLADANTNRHSQPEASSNSKAKAMAPPAAAPQPTGVPLYDPAWQAAYDRIAQLQSQLVKAITQDPLDYRRLVCAAMQLAMRPWRCSRDAVEGQCSDKQQHVGVNGAARSSGVGWSAADPYHAAAMLVRLMT